MTSTQQTQIAAADTEQDMARSPEKQDADKTDGEKKPELSNLVLIGSKRKAGFYAGLVKNLFAQEKYPDIILQGRGERGVLRTAQSVNILTRWGYCEIRRLKTKMERGPSLKVVLVKAATFEQQHEAYQK